MTILHSQFGVEKAIAARKLHSLIRKGYICFGGNKNLKIYGTLSCKSGKRMKSENRIFFTTLQEAEALGFRPCGHCMKTAYDVWKKTKSNVL